MTVETATAEAIPTERASAVSLIDSDVHNYPNTIDELTPFMSERWRAYIGQSGFTGPVGPAYPKGFASAARRDAWPGNGKIPGGDPEFARGQLLDQWEIDYAILNPLYGQSSVHNIDFANALTRAVNDWTASSWLETDERWRGSIVVNVRDPAGTAEEIRRAARDPRFVQVLLFVRSHAPYGRREFQPIFEAACDVGLPIGIHFGGNGGVPITPCGWPSFYLEDHTAMALAFQAQVMSLVCEGVFEKYSGTKVTIIEGGFAWLPALMWRLDKNFRALRDEVPWLKKLPSEYILEFFRATTQPMEEPDDDEHLLTTIEMIGHDDFLMFATDYPHWDFDAPNRAIPPIVSGALRQKIMTDNAAAWYDFARS